MADIVLVIWIQNFSAWSFYLPACASLWVYSFSSTSSFWLTHLLKNVLVGVVNLLNLCTALRIPFTKGGVGLSRVLKFLALPNKGWLWSNPCHKVIYKHLQKCCSMSLFIVRSPCLLCLEVLNCQKCQKFHNFWKIAIWRFSLFVFEMIKNPSLNLFCKCICLCHCLCRCLFVGQVMSPNHSDQMSHMSQASWVTL